MTYRTAALAAACLLVLLTAARPASAAPEARLWERWTAHDDASRVAVDHCEWEQLLRTHVTAGPDGVNRVRYAALRERDAGRLDAYLGRLADVPVSRLARREQLAFWINLYNALTVRVVVDHYPVGSIRDVNISPGLFAAGPWGRKLIAVEGVPLSLDDVEHRILRPVWGDPRIHYAVNCASIGCPDLLRTAYTAANVDALLEAGARRYVNHARGARIEAGRLTVSSIYHWFEADFGGTHRGVIAHLRRHAAPALRDALEGVSTIDAHAYDWSLNDAR